ncbi:hypothetical protein F4824DRAFT_73911 [Ustulina deusta]|nr:hypothetical protein F4824DRAFT_73911 [Ustulina deusta]
MEIEQNISSNYLKKEKLQEFLDERFPKHAPIKIKRVEKTSSEQYVFTVPEKVPDAEIDALRE